MEKECAVGRPGIRCLLDTEIQTLVDVYNEKVDEKERLPKTKSTNQLLSLLMERTECSGEECTVCKILEVVTGTVYEPIVTRIREMAFKVDGPESLTALLDSFLIIRICRQISGNNDGTKFGGVYTVDFMIPPIIGMYGDPKMVWKDYRKEKWKQLQLVLNIDHRMGTGQHWTALTIAMDEDRGQIQYFDSYGQSPPDGAQHGSRPYRDITDEQGQFLSLLGTWINDVRKSFMEQGVAMGYVHNTTCHQSSRDQSNCGPYSLVFLALRAKGVPFSSINGEAITMKEIEATRSKLYRRAQDYKPTPP